jgi:hypothetical protein
MLEIYNARLRTQRFDCRHRLCGKDFGLLVANRRLKVIAMLKPE